MNSYKNGHKPPTNELSAIQQTLRLLIEPGQVVELRILELDGKPCVASGYFDDLTKLAEWATRYNGRGAGMYLTLNPVLPDLKARAYNRIQEWAKTTTSDKEIVHRRWLMLDFDPKRPSGISSSETEHQAALTRANECKNYLVEAMNWTEPLMCASGNGAHLLFRIDLPNDTAANKLLEKCLKALDYLFSDEAVQIDTGVFNPARLCKLYGTLVKKGDNLPERPHRTAAILTAPATLQVVELERLEYLAKLAEEIEPDLSTNYPQTYNHNGDNRHNQLIEIKNKFDLLSYAERHFPGSTKREGKGEMRISGNQGFMVNAAKGFWMQHGTGKGGDALDLTGYVIYRDMWNRRNPEMFKTALQEAAHYAGIPLSNNELGNSGQWSMVSGQNKTKSDISAIHQPPTPDTPYPPPEKRKRLWHVEELQNFPTPEWLVSNELLRQSLAFLIGEPGCGKTFISLDYALKIAEKENVVYVAGEAPAGFHQRIEAWREHHQPQACNFYLWSDPLLPTDVINRSEFLAEIQELKPSLIVIDTLARSAIGLDENSARDMGLFVAGCDRIKEETGACVLVVHHTNKGGGSERGSSALRGAADTLIKVSSEGDLVKISCEKQKDAPEFESRYMAWQPVKNSIVPVPANHNQPLTVGRIIGNTKQVLETLALEIFEEAGASVRRLLEALGWNSEGKRVEIHRILSKLKKAGYVSQDTKGEPFRLTCDGRELLGQPPF
jgi:AAA domain